MLTAFAIFSPEKLEDRDIQADLLEGGVGDSRILFRFISHDSGHGREDDPVTVVVFGQ